MPRAHMPNVPEGRRLTSNRSCTLPVRSIFHFCLGFLPFLPNVAAAETSAKSQEADGIVLPPPVITEQTTGPDPSVCRVVLEDMGNVGIRIADAQALATDSLTHLRKRLGQEAVLYEGLIKSKLQMRKQLGKRSQTRQQKAQIKYLEACAAHAPYRVSVRFGKKRKQEFLTLECRLTNAKKPLARRDVDALYFEDIRARLNEAMPDFCPQLESPPDVVPTPEIDAKGKQKGKLASKKAKAKAQPKEKRKSRAELREDEDDFEEAYEEETILPKEKRASENWLPPPRR